MWDIIGEQTIEREEENIMFCINSSVTLQANSNIISPQYSWNTGETGSNITVSNPGTYIVEITDGCLMKIITFQVIEKGIPQIQNISSDATSIIIEAIGTGELEYSLDGITYQTNPIFLNIEGGKYTVYVKDECGETIQEFIHLIIPKYFTPNGDSIHDVFELKGIEHYTSNEVSIFNRFGKLLYFSKNSDFKWDGTYNGKPLPISDYWYSISIEGQKITGHFTLKR
jgi:gliding motility-associated-like protein